MGLLRISLRNIIRYVWILFGFDIDSNKQKGRPWKKYSLKFDFLIPVNYWWIDQEIFPSVQVILNYFMLAMS